MAISSHVTFELVKSPSYARRVCGFIGRWLSSAFASVGSTDIGPPPRLEERGNGPFASSVLPSDGDRSGPEEPEPGPQLAFRADGAILMSASGYLGDRDMRGRTMWTAVVLEPHEVDFVRGHIVDSDQDAASQLAAQMPKKRKR